MRLKDLEFKKLLPVFMRKDPAVLALSAVMDDVLSDPDDHLKAAAAWDRLEKLSDMELDELAWEFDIDWYDSGAPRQIRINQIRSAQMVKRKRGTRWASEEVVRNVFGNAWINEWWEINDEPYTFEIVTKNAHVTKDLYDRALIALEKAKNVRSIMKRFYYLDETAIDVSLSGTVHDGTFTYRFCGIPFCGEYSAAPDHGSGSLLLNDGFHDSTFKFDPCGDWRIHQTGTATTNNMVGVQVAAGGASVICPCCGKYAAGNTKMFKKEG